MEIKLAVMVKKDLDDLLTDEYGMIWRFDGERGETVNVLSSELHISGWVGASSPPPVVNMGFPPIQEIHMIGERALIYLDHVKAKQ